MARVGVVLYDNFYYFPGTILFGSNVKFFANNWGSLPGDLTASI